MRPVLASHGTAILRGRQRVHEVSWGAIRVLADVADGRPGFDLRSSPRRGRWTNLFDKE
jgi:hypothetical protein